MKNKGRGQIEWEDMDLSDKVGYIAFTGIGLAFGILSTVLCGYFAFMNL